jgi:hypothetical protein
MESLTERSDYERKRRKWSGVALIVFVDFESHVANKVNPGVDHLHTKHKGSGNEHWDYLHK